MDETNDNAPLEAIRRKERELAELLEAAKKRANEKLARARERAAEIQNQAESAGQREAEQFLHDEMARVKEAVAALKGASAREAEELTRRGEKHLDRAVQTVIDFIFPQ